MARQLRAADATALLAEVFPLAEQDAREQAAVDLPPDIVAATERLFVSDTAAYREALVGCAVARLLDPRINIRLPATEHGDDAFSGRSLQDQVITPFLRARAVPVSASPYLSALRGGARFVVGGAPRIQRDKAGFAALVEVVDYLGQQEPSSAKAYLRYLLRRFVMLREGANIVLRQIARPNLEQLGRLIGGLLAVKSGGRFPAFLATAMFQTLSECHALAWDVEFQGINVADKASGAVGDITIRKGGKIILGVEVTERPIDQNRVTVTFDQKVSPNGLSDYLFVSTAAPEAGAIAMARNFTAVGHEINFVPMQGWLIHNLATIGPVCRAMFQLKLLDLLNGPGIPVDIKVAWNDKMDAAIANG